VAALFCFASLLVGRLLRANVPSQQKLEAYECGEQAVGSTEVQFDLRFYVVALVFIIFEVEVTLFFPTAAIFGKATHLMNPGVSQQQATTLLGQLGATDAGRGRVDSRAAVAKTPGSQTTPLAPYLAQKRAATTARTLALAAMADLGLFFAVILAGFAYVWWRGDLNWVRAIGPENGELRVLQI
jgi:NADH-quinone oxidoreductase subunit A